MSAEAGDQIEGRHAVLEALEAGVPIRQVLLLDGICQIGTASKIASRCAKLGIEIKHMPRRELDRMSKAHGAHQGVIALVKAFYYSTLDEIINASSNVKDCVVLLLDHVQDPGNLGAIARSAECAGALGMVIPRQRCAGASPVAFKASAGALNHIMLAQEANIASCCLRLKEEGFWIIGASEKAQECIWDVSLDGRIAIVLGSEGRGISDLVLRRCDMLCSLPQTGKVSSLNVAQAATVMLYERLRRMNSR